jgi:hypothetical protein
MRTLIKTASFFGLMAFIASPAMAQRGGGFGMGPGPLLTNKSVQQELKVDKGQADKLDALGKELGDKQREAMQGFQDLTQEERRAKFTELNKSMTESVKKSLPDILKPDQVKRFFQMQLQVRNANAFSDPEVQSKLKLTEDQKGKITGFLEDSRGQMREIFQSFGDDREGAMKKMAEMNKETMGKATGVLTSEQKATWKEMVGEPFDYKPEFRRPGA